MSNGMKIMTPMENIFRKSKRVMANPPISAAEAKVKVDPESARVDSKLSSNPFKAFDIVLDPGSELEIKTKDQLEEEIAMKKDSSITAYMKPIEPKPVNKKRKISEMTKKPPGDADPQQKDKRTSE